MFDANLLAAEHALIADDFHTGSCLSVPAVFVFATVTINHRAKKNQCNRDSQAATRAALSEHDCYNAQPHAAIGGLTPVRI
jgi:hypothetical protein